MNQRVDLPLFLIAIAAALLIKLGVSEPVELRERTLRAQIEYTQSDDVILTERTKEVEVRLRGPSDEIATLTPFSVAVEVQIQPDNLGNVNIRLDRSNVRMPGDLEVLSLDPDSFDIQIERMISSRIPIRVELSGEPVAGAQVGPTRIDPDEALVRGPESLVSKLELIHTRPVSLDGRAFSFAETTTLDPKSSLIQVIEPKQVIVHVAMREPELSPAVQGIIREEPVS